MTPTPDPLASGRRRALALVVVIVLLFAAATVAYMRHENSCGGRREAVVRAKAERNVHGFTPERMAAVDTAARVARDHGCDVDDLVGPVDG